MVRLFVTTSIGLMVSASMAWGAPSQFTYQGQIIKPNGQPLEGSSVTFTIEVLSPAPTECVLFEEQHTVNMINSNGVFSLEVGSGSQSGSDYEDLNTLTNAISNTTGMVSPTTCVAGPNYTPVASDGRQLRVTFDDGSGPTTLGQNHQIVSVPYADSASSVDGLTSANILSVDTTGTNVLTQSNLVWVFETARFTELQALIGGTSSQYLSGSPTADFSVNSNKITDVATPTAAGDAANKGYVDGSIGGNAASIGVLGGGNTGETLVWNGTNWTSAAPAGDSTKLPLAGGTMTGAIAMGNQDITGIKDAGVNNDLSVGNNVAVTGSLSANGVSTSGSLAFYNGANFVGFQAPAGASDLIWTLPGSDGTANQALSTNAAGVLSWRSYVESASNVGTLGVGPFKQNANGDLEFRNINAAADDKVTVTLDAANNEIDLSVDESNFDPTAIPNTAAGNVAALNVQAAINELDTEKVAKAGDNMSGALTMDTENEVRFADNDDSHYVGFKAPAAITAAASFVWELPVDDGTNGQVLQTNGAGVLSFVNLPGGTVQSASNVNTLGEGVFKQLNGTDLEFRGINAAPDAKVTVALDAANNEIDLSVDESNFDPTAIPNTAAGNIVATSVQAAINELDGDKVAKAGDTMTGQLLIDGGADQVQLAIEGDALQTANLVEIRNSAATVVASVSSDGTVTAGTDLTTKTYVDTAISGISTDEITDADNNTKVQVEEGANDDTIRFDTAGFERVVIDAGGNVGIGTTAPNSIFHINGGTGSISTGMTFGDGDTGLYESVDDTLQTTINGVNRWFITTTEIGTVTGSRPSMIANVTGLPNFLPDRSDGDTGVGDAGADDTLGFYAGGEKMRIDSSGNVGIGTTAPSQKLDVEGRVLSGAAGTLNGETGSLLMEELAANESAPGVYEKTGFRAPDALAADIIYTLPGTAPGAGQILSSDASGNLSWIADDTGGAGDILNGGNTTAAAVTIGTNDNFDLNLETNGTVSLILGSGGDEAWFINSDWSTGTTGSGTLISRGATSGNTASSIQSYNAGASGQDALLLNPVGGNVGIGTTSPTSRLEIAAGSIKLDNNFGLNIEDASGTERVILRLNASDNVILGSNSNSSIIHNTSTAHRFQVGGTEHVRIDSSGSLGIGTTAPSQKLDVEGRVLSGAAGTLTGETGSLLMEELAANESAPGVYEKTGFRAPDALAADIIYTLPGTAPGAGQILSSDASGNLSWISDDTGGAGDFMADGSVAMTGQLDAADGTAAAPGLSFASDQDTGIFSDTANELGFSTAATERMTIDATGNVGIGTATPNDKLHVNGSVVIGATTAEGLIFSWDAFNSSVAAQTNSLVLETNRGTAADDDIIFQGTRDTGTSEWMRIKGGTGNVGLGTTAPSQKLDVEGRVLSGAAGTLTGETGSLLMEELAANESAPGVYEKTGFRAPDALAADIIYTLPGTAPGAGQILSSDASGNLSWIADNTGGAGDFMADGSVAMTGQLDGADGTAAAPGLSFASDQDTGIFSDTANELGFSTAATERMTIDASGNVGIGTTTPATSLHINKAQNSTTMMTVSNTTAGTGSAAGIYLTSDATTATIGQLSSTFTGTGMKQPNEFLIEAGGASNGIALTAFGVDPIRFGTTDTERMRIDGAGNVGVGTTAPSQKLDVEGRVLSGAAGTLTGETGSLLMEELATNESAPGVYERTGFRAPDALAADLIYTLPSAAPGAGQFLQSDASGNLTWAAAGGGSGDFLADGTVAMTGQLDAADGTAAAPGLSFASDQDTGIFSDTVNELGFSTAATERMTIDATGNVGIGASTLATSTGAVDKILKIDSGSTSHKNAELILSGRGTAANRGGVITGEDSRITDVDKRLASIGLVREDSGTVSNSDGQITFSTTENGSISQHMVLTSKGHLGVGNVSVPATIETGSQSGLIHVVANAGSAEMHLDAVGTSSNYVSTLNLLNNGTRVGYIRSEKSASSAVDGNLEFATHNGTTLNERMRIDLNGNVGVGTTAPSQKLDVEGRVLSGAVGTLTGETGSLLMEELAANESAPGVYEKTGFRAPDALAADLIYTLPGTAPGAGQFLQSDASGNLTWAAAGGGSGDFMADGSVPMTGQLNAVYGTAAAPGISFAGDPDTGIRRPATNGVSLVAGGTDHLRVHSTGRIELGEVNGTTYYDVEVRSTDASRGKLRVANLSTAAAAAAGVVLWNNTDSLGAGLDFNSSNATEANAVTLYGAAGNYPMMFETNSVERLRITGAGDVGLGTTTPSQKLDVEGRVLSGAAGTLTGETGSLLMEELAANESAPGVYEKTGFRAPDALAADIIYTLPGTAPGAGEILSSDASGNLSWIAAGGGGGDGHSLDASDGSPTDVVSVNATGKVLIGPASAVGKLNIEEPSTETGTQAYATISEINAVPAGASFADYRGLAGVAAKGNNANMANGDLTGVWGVAAQEGTGAVDELRGVFGQANVRPSGGNADLAIGGHFEARNDHNSNSITTAQGLFVEVNNNGTGSITTGYGVYINDIEATTDYGIYQAGADDDNYFAGSVGIGTTAPNEKLTLEGGMSFKEMTAPTTDVATYHKLYVDTADNSLKFRDEAGTVTDLLAGGTGDFMADGSVVMTGPFEAATGSALSPSIRFDADPDSGFFSNADNNIGISVGGALRYTIRSGAIQNETAGGWLLSRSGVSASFPSYAFENDTDTGLFRATTNELGFSTAGSEAMRIDAAGNVGIGTANPNYGLHYVGDTSMIENYGSRTAIIGRRANGTSGAPTAVGTGNGLLLVGGRGYDGSSFSGNQAYIEFEASENWSGVAKGAAITFTTTANGTTTSNERMRIDASGNVGIGTTAPSNALHVVSANTPAVLERASTVDGNSALRSLILSRTYDGGAGADGIGPVLTFRAETETEGVEERLGSIRMIASDATAGTVDGSLSLYTSTNGTESEKMIINSSGDMGVGSSSPRAKLDVNGSIASAPATAEAANTIDFANSNFGYTAQSCGAVTFNLHNMKDGATYTMAVQGTTSGTCAFNAYSDAGTTALTVKLPPSHGATTAATETLYSFVVIGTTVYVAWVPGY